MNQILGRKMVFTHSAVIFGCPVSPLNSNQPGFPQIIVDWEEKATPLTTAWNATRGSGHPCNL